MSTSRSDLDLDLGELAAELSTALESASPAFKRRLGAEMAQAGYAVAEVDDVTLLRQGSKARQRLVDELSYVEPELDRHAQTELGF